MASKDVRGIAEYRCYVKLQRDPTNYYGRSERLSIPKKEGERPEETEARLREAFFRLEQTIRGCISTKLVGVKKL